jgi:hypothetical protein
MAHAMSVIREMSERIHIVKSIQEQAMKIFKVSEGPVLPVLGEDRPTFQ